jgi:hypothetical protein
MSLRIDRHSGGTLSPSSSERQPIQFDPLGEEKSILP